jgi:hypothetical protein
VGRQIDHGIVPSHCPPQPLGIEQVDIDRFRSSMPQGLLLSQGTSDRRHLVPSCTQVTNDTAPDHAGCSGEEDAHGNSP